MGERVCPIDAPEVQIWTYSYGPTTSQTYLSTICWGIRLASNNVSKDKNLSLIYYFLLIICLNIIYIIYDDIMNNRIR